jgi:hypothetical protein
VTNELRQRLQDAPGFTEEEWVKARLTAFIERPNVWLRGEYACMHVCMYACQVNFPFSSYLLYNNCETLMTCPPPRNASE